MVLVPEAMVKNIQPMKKSQIQQESATESTKSVQTPGNVSSRLDKDMYDILHADVKDKRQKWKLFSQALQRFLFFNDDKHESSNGQTECAESTDDDALDSGGDVVTLKSTIPREFIGNTSLLNDGSDTPLTNLKRKYGRISRHFSDSAVTPSNLAEPPQSGDEKEADNVEDCSEVLNEAADSTLGYSTPGTKKKKPSWATLTLNK
ncbi:hypothetical protein QAD02_013161 [Eretmocerus hayati]|uniref:Uncharacterized protein n=1 Tax=Eretmocerus hayati TaxID=131215 RepID=A0ACC2P4B2_9HYME|nr:hypothetical protein QAD02_013161 [Eretmocerus hayati]